MNQSPTSEHDLTDKPFTTPCRICGRPVHLTIAVAVGPDMSERLKRQVSGAITHDECYDEYQGGRQREERAKWYGARAQEWLTICPPVYQDTDPARLPSHQLGLTMAWKFNSNGLTLHGRTGTSKTRCLLYLLHREFSAGKMVLFLTHQEFSRTSLHLIDFNRQRGRWVRLLQSVDILAFDDLGKAKFTDYSGQGRASEETLFDILETRIANLLPTMFTTEFDSGQLEAAMSPERGPSFLRRLKEFTTPVSFAQTRR